MNRNRNQTTPPNHFEIDKSIKKSSVENYKKNSQPTQYIALNVQDMLPSYLIYYCSKRPEMTFHCKNINK